MCKTWGTPDPGLWTCMVKECFLKVSRNGLWCKRGPWSCKLFVLKALELCWINDIFNVLPSLAVVLTLGFASLCISDKWTRRTVRPWLLASAACFLRCPPAWTLCLCKTSFTKQSGRWGVRQRGVFHFGLFTSVKTKHHSDSPLPRFYHPAIRSCRLRPQPSWWL